MIEQLKNEIFELENLLKEKQNKLSALIFEEQFKTDKLLAIIELNDQFSCISEVLLIDNNQLSIKKLEESYKNKIICYNIYIYKILDVDKLKEYYKDLIHSTNAGSFGEDSIYQWMSENEQHLINN